MRIKVASLSILYTFFFLTPPALAAWGIFCGQNYPDNSWGTPSKLVGVPQDFILAFILAFALAFGLLPVVLSLRAVPPLMGAAIAWLRGFPRPPPLGLPPGRPLSGLFLWPAPCGRSIPRGALSGGTRSRPALSARGPRTVSGGLAAPSGRGRCVLVLPSWWVCGAAWLRSAPAVAASRRCSRWSLRAGARHGLCALSLVRVLSWFRACGAGGLRSPPVVSLQAARPLLAALAVCAPRRVSVAGCCSLCGYRVDSRAAAAPLRLHAAAPLVGSLL